MNFIRGANPRDSGGRLLRLHQKLVDSLGIFLGVIEDKMNVRRAAELDALGQLVANVTDGCGESPNRVFLFGFVSHHAHEHARMFEVGRHADLGNCDEAHDPWIFQLTDDHNAKLVPNLLGNAFVPVSRDGHDCFTECGILSDLKFTIRYNTSSSCPTRSRPRWRSDSSSTVRRDCSTCP